MGAFGAGVFNVQLFFYITRVVCKPLVNKAVLADFKDFSFELDDMEINVFCATDDPIHFMKACFEECPNALDEYVDEDTENIYYKNNDSEEIGEALEAFSTWI